MSDSESTTRVCTVCGRSFPYTSEFFPPNGVGQPLRPSCRECGRARTRAWIAANPERHAAKNKKWAQEHPERYSEWNHCWYMRHKDRTQARVLAYRARKRAAGPAFTPDDVTAQHNRQKGKCFYCGKSLNGVYDIDHVMPLALGGSNGPENIVLACPHCNGSKHAKHPMDFAGILF